MIEIIPAIIAENFEELEEKVRLVEPYVSVAQIDIMDGRFVPSQTINGYDELNRLKTDLKFEAHLMVVDPREYVEKLIETGKVDRFILHIESDADFDGLIELIHSRGYQVGLSLNPETKNESTLEYLDKIDFIQFMTVNPGYYGSPFLESVLDKMSDMKYIHPDIPLQADGGVDKETAPKIIQAGATTLVSGSYIFNHDYVGEAIKSLQE